MSSVHTLADVPRPDVGAPQPRLVADEAGAVLLYHLPAGAGPTLARIRLLGLVGLRWSPLTDDVLQSHPLGQAGVELYTPAEITPSGWLESLVAETTLPGAAPQDHLHRLRHLVFPFHDSTLEVAADGYEASTLYAPMNEALLDAARL